jgi:hypothetical protein
MTRQGRVTRREDAGEAIRGDAAGTVDDERMFCETLISPCRRLDPRA